MLPIIAMTMGDPAGIGPELVLKVLSDKKYYESCRPFVIGDLLTLPKTSTRYWAVTFAQSNHHALRREI